MSWLLGRLIAAYAVWHAWKRRKDPIPVREYNRVIYPWGVEYYDRVDPGELRWHPTIPPPVPLYVLKYRITNKPPSGEFWWTAR